MKKFTQLLGLALVALLLLPQSIMAEQRVTMYFVDGSGNRVRQVTATIGEEFIEPTLVVEPANTGGRVVYESTDYNVANVDMMSGDVTLGTTGRATITATFGGTEEYGVNSASYQLIVEAAQDTTPVVPPTPTCPEARWNLPADNVLTLHVGDVVSVPELMGGAGSLLYLSMKYIDNIRVAELTESDMIWARGVGTTTFTGSVLQGGADGSGQTLQCDYTFTIVVEAAAPEKADPQLSFSATEVNVELGETFVAPTLINPNNITLTPTNSKWYTAWDSQVAQVNEQTGEVTLLGNTGDATIYLEFMGNDTYKNAIISYDIHVTTMGLIIGGVVVNSQNKDNILPGNGTITYDPITHTLTMTNATISSSSMNLSPAIKRATKDELPASGILYTEKYPLTIIINGGNAITGVDAGIYTVSAPVTMMGGKDGGNIRISATTVGVKAEAYKIYQCSVTAYGGGAGIAVNELGVATGGWLMAQGPSLAIQANSLVMAEDNNGEGIAILTEGVTFKPKQGFLDSEGKQAKFVEIGKVAVVVPDDEVTTIDFSQTDPEGNESVIFSADANNTYNETTGQLEITTTLTDEVVANALETLVPGSSAWMDLLPGSLVFDIPAGEGEIEIECLTVPGYSLQIKVEGVAAVSITQASLGWAKVQYNVAAPVHVVIYLHAASGSAPARIAANMNDADPTVGAYIQAVKITPKKASTAIDIIEVNKGENGKVLLNGQLYIIRDGRVFTATGTQVK